MVDLNNDTVTTYTGWVVLHRMTRMDCTTFIAPAIFGTKQDADSYASAFDNIVAIMPIEWEE